MVKVENEVEEVVSGGGGGGGVEVEVEVVVGGG